MNGYKEFKLLSEPEKAYLAAFLDGEGTVGLYKMTAGPYRTLKVMFYNTDLGTLNFVAGLLDTKVRVHSKATAKWKEAYVVMVSAHYALRLLGEIRPYMKQIGKCKRTDLILDGYQRTRLYHNPTPDQIKNRIQFETIVMGVDT